jgi:hypothetical protein
MRVLVERGSVPAAFIEQIVTEMPEAEVVILGRRELREALRLDDVVITRISELDLAFLPNDKKPVVTFGKLRATPLYPAYDGRPLQLRCLELARSFTSSPPQAASQSPTTSSISFAGRKRRSFARSTSHSTGHERRSKRKHRCDS